MIYVPYDCIGFNRWKLKQMKALGDLKSFLLGDEMVEWIKALNILRSERCCPRIKSAKMLISSIKKMTGQTNQPTNQPTNRPTDKLTTRPGNKDVTLPIKNIVF